MSEVFLGKLLLLLLIYTNNSHAYQLGRCPYVRTQTDFNASKSLGKWYEYAKYPLASETLSKCITLELEQLPNETYSVQRTLTGKVTEVQLGFTGTATLTHPGVLQISAESLGNILGNTTLSILGTDYKNYFVIFSCEELLGLGILHQQHAFVLTRQQQPSQEVVTAAQNALSSNGLSVRNLVQTDQVNCFENQ